MPLEEVPPLRLRDVVFSTVTSHANMCRCIKYLLEASRYSSGIILNTFLELEEPELQKVVNGLDAPTYAIGPLHKISSGSESSLIEQDRSCLEWLDKQMDDSVLYVSFGSLASMDQKELLETAWGLANSQRPFLWVVRHNLVQSSEPVSLPDGLDAAIHGRGMVVPWAPQQEVLGHRAVGGFWTHNGWNSTLESICEGVPMICRPQFADQMINMRYVQEVWKTGFEIEGELEREKIEWAIRRLFFEEGGEIRLRANELRNKAVKCMEEGGSSRTVSNPPTVYGLCRRHVHRRRGPGTAGGTSGRALPPLTESRLHGPWMAYAIAASTGNQCGDFCLWWTVVVMIYPLGSDTYRSISVPQRSNKLPTKILTVLAY
jgi:UDP-glucosyltransferase BX8/BX9